MKTTWAMLAAAVAVTIILAFSWRYDIQAGQTGPFSWRLDRWTGELEWCGYNNAATLVCDQARSMKQ